MRIRITVSTFVLLALIGSIVSAQNTGTSFTVRIENSSDMPRYENAGVAAIPVDSAEPGPALPGSGYELRFSAEAGQRLSFVTMFVQSNDLFFAPDPAGIALFDAEGNPINGDITDQIALWDAGTEVNEEPGMGPNQPPRQSGPDTGADENGLIRLINDVDDGFNYPDVADVIRANLSSDEEGNFTLRIDNLSEDAFLPTPITPVVWVVHDDLSDMMEPGAGVFFSVGEPDRGHGLENVAEDGDPANLGTVVQGSDIATPITPVVWAVHDRNMEGGVFFNAGAADFGLGLENVAEDGDPSALAGNIEGMYSSTGVAAIPSNSEEPGPATPGNHYEFTITATPGEALSFVTMFVESNDWFFAPMESGINLFDEDGNPIRGEITVYLWDAGTEVDEEPGAGPNQPMRQAGPNTGEDENGVAQLIAGIDNGFRVPPVASLIRVSIQPAE